MRFVRKAVLWFGGVVALLYAALCVFAYWPGHEELPVAQLTTAADKFVVADGVRLRYREYGVRAAGRPNIVLIHGFANSLQSFRELAPRLAECCYVVALDMPGFGLSDKPAPFDYHNEPQALRIVAAARALGLDRPVYGGHSLGGAIALWAAHRDPNAAGLVLMNPGILTTGVPKIAQITLPPLPRLSAKQFGNRSFRESFLKKSYVEPSRVTPQVIDEVMLGSRAEGYTASMTNMMQQYAEGEELPLLPQVRVPTLILWGNQDRNKPLAEANELAERIPGAQLVRFASAGHYVHEEAAEECAISMRVWLDAIFKATN